MQRARNDPDAPPLLRLFANAMERYHSGEVRYVKLLDGGIVDNYGLAGLTIARLASTRPTVRSSPRRRVKLRRMLFMVVDAGRAPSGTWAQTVEGPAGVTLITAASDTATESGAVGSYSAFQDTMADWQQSLIDWRCKLSPADRRRYGAPPDWNCRDVKICRSAALPSISSVRSAQPRSMPSRRASCCRPIRSICSLLPAAMRCGPIRYSARSSPLWGRGGPRRGTAGGRSRRRAARGGGAVVAQSVACVGYSAAARVCPSRRLSVSSSSLGGLRDHRARREDRFGARGLERLVVLRRDHAADHHHDVAATVALQLGFQLRHQRQMRAGERRDTEDVHVILDRLARGFGRRREQRPDIDVEADIGERRRDHLLAAIVAVLADLGDEDARAAAFILLEFGDAFLHTARRRPTCPPPACRRRRSP